MLSPLPSLKKFCVWSVNHGIYTCGSVPVRWPPFVVREGITCTSAVELSYYSCKCFNNVYAYCANDECSVENTVKDKYQTVLSTCWDCESNGKKPITRGEYKDGAIRQCRQVKRESMAGQPSAEKRPLIPWLWTGIFLHYIGTTTLLFFWGIVYVTGCVVESCVQFCFS